MVANRQEMLPDLEKAESYEPVLTAVKQCVKFISAHEESRPLAKIAQEEWDKQCDLEPFRESKKNK